MNKFKFGGINSGYLYPDETVMRMCRPTAVCFIQLAAVDKEKARKGIRR